MYSTDDDKLNAIKLETTHVSYPKRFLSLPCKATILKDIGKLQEQ